MLEELNKSPLLGTACAIVASSNAAQRCPASEKLILEHKRLRGLGTGASPSRGKSLAEEQYSGLLAMAEGVDVLIILTGMGGGSGSGVTPVLARAAKEAGALALVFASMPFSCEGRSKTASEALRETREIADGVVCLYNDKILHLIDENTPYADAFGMSRSLLAQAVRGFHNWLVHPGPMQVSFDELCRVLQDQHSESAFATVEAAGPNRCNALLDMLLGHPLLENGALLAEAQTILVSIVGGPSMTMAEVNNLIAQISRRNQAAEVMTGAGIAEHMGDALSVTVLVSRRVAEPESAATPEKSSYGADRNNPPPSNMPSFEGRNRTAAKGTSPLTDGGSVAGGATRKAPKLRQGQLPLALTSRGRRFENSEPTMHKGEDLDVPTFLRRGVLLN